MQAESRSDDTVDSSSAIKVQVPVLEYLYREVRCMDMMEYSTVLYRVYLKDLHAWICSHLFRLKQPRDCLLLPLIPTRNLDEVRVGKCSSRNASCCHEPGEAEITLHL